MVCISGIKGVVLMSNSTILLGKFAPLHKGHEHFIRKSIEKSLASQPENQIFIVVCYDEKLLNQIDSAFIRTGLNSAYRLRAVIQYVYSIYPTEILSGKIKVVQIDETDVKGYPDGFKEFTQLVLNETHKKVTDFTLAFSSEIDYDNYYYSQFPNIKHEFIDPNREQVPISATALRESIFTNWHYLSDFAKQDFIYRIVIMGVESTGKSTLVQQLYNFFDNNQIFKGIIGTVNEVGVDVCINQYDSKEMNMFGKGYLETMLLHKLAELKHYGTKALLISDTNNLITHFSAESYSINTGIKHLHYRNAKITNEYPIAIEENYELGLYLSEDKNDWVNAELRFGRDKDSRTLSANILKGMIYGNHQNNEENIDSSTRRSIYPVIVISEGIDTRFNTALDLVIRHLQEIDKAISFR